MGLKGAILGDILCSQYEHSADNKHNEIAILLTDKCHFTGNTVQLLATKYALLHGIPFADAYAFFCNKYLNVGYSDTLTKWLLSEDLNPCRCDDFCTGVRVASLVDCYDTIKNIQDTAALSAASTHDSVEASKGAIVTSTCIWMAKSGYNKDDILHYVSTCYTPDMYAYSPVNSLNEMRKNKWEDDTCSKVVPLAIRCIYEANTFEKFIQNIISIDCDASAVGAIGGGIAEELFDRTADPFLLQLNDIVDNQLTVFLSDVLHAEPKQINQ